MMTKVMQSAHDVVQEEDAEYDWKYFDSIKSILWWCRE